MIWTSRAGKWSWPGARKADGAYYIIANNSHFDTTEGNVADNRMVPLNLPCREHLEDDKISHVASLMADLIVSKIRIGQIKRKAVNESIPEFLEDWTSFVSPERFGWFDDINFSYASDDHITIYGLHSLNLQYSKYAVELISLILSKMYGYQSDVTTLNVTENSFVVSLKPS